MNKELQARQRRIIDTLEALISKLSSTPPPATQPAGKNGGDLDNEKERLKALDEALKNLAAADQRKSQVVELRFFGGLSIDETAEVLKVSPGTVMRDWTLAKAWLRREITS